MTPTAFLFARSRAALRTLCMALLVSGLGALASTSLAAPEPDPLTTRILTLERDGRATPVESAAALEQLLPSTPEHSPQRLELLTVHGLMLALTSRAPDAEKSALQLDAWGRDAEAPLAPSAAAAALLIRARALTSHGNLQSADAMLQDALTRLPETTLPRQRYRFVSVQASVIGESGKLDVGVRLGHEALALADLSDELWRQADARNTLAGRYTDARQFERARALTLEARALAEKAQDWVGVSRSYSNDGIALDGLGDLLGERRAFERAIEFALLAGSKRDEALMLANMADLFLKASDYPTALSYAERALPLSRDLGDTTIETVALANIGLAHISMHQVELGKRYMREATAIDERRGSLTSVSDLNHDLGVYLEKAGDLKGAVAAYHEHRRIAAGLLRGDQQKAILAVQEQYDAERRTRSLALLNRENEIKAEQLRRRDLQQRLWWLLAAAFALSFAVVVLLYRRVRQTNQRLATSNELLKVQSERDPLTGLANRRHFQAAMRQLAEDGKLSGTVDRIDIDHFKPVNDQHGHSAGDAVLVEVARRLRETLREHDLIVRWGGEEFLVVVQQLGPEQVDALAQRMLSVLDRAAVTVDTHRIAVTASIGFATFPIGPASLRVSWERAINLVDTAMYLAKAHGRNRAYGVRLLHARDEASLEAITHSLEAAWRDGQVALTLLQGRSPLAVAA